MVIQGGGTGAWEEDARMVDELRRHLGSHVDIDLPRMPHEAEPDEGRWGPAIGLALDRAHDRTGSPLVVVGHSLGGYLLLRHLIARPEPAPIAGLLLLAVPFPAADPLWEIEGFELPPDFAARLPHDAPVILHSADDDGLVPVHHRDLYARSIPGSISRSGSGGHQLAGGMAPVADDIRSLLRG